jgi:hypothetical protein
MGTLRRFAIRSTCGLALAIGGATPLLSSAASAASAEERCKVSYEFGNEETTFPQQLRLDVSDIPGHRIAVFEIHHGPNPNAKPNCEGFKTIDSSVHGFSDTIDRNGRAWGYSVSTLDDGDKIYSQWSGTTVAVTGDDGSVLTTYSGTTTWIGGTGRYLGVRGLTRGKSETFYVKDSQGKLSAKTNKGLEEGEYWFEK